MLRASALALAACIAATSAASAQTTSVLHIRVTFDDGSGQTSPVAGHRLLISDNPATAPPREIVTAADGTADVKLKPANYTVESDEPIVRLGKSWRWIEAVDVIAGADATITLTTANARLEEPPGADVAEESGTSLLLRWQDSVVALWTATARASGFVADARGLVATSQRVIGDATTIEVQLSNEVKVLGRVLAAEPGRDVAIIAIDPAAVGAIQPVPLGCASAPTTPKEKDRAIALGWPLRREKSADYAGIGRVGPHALETDFSFATGGAGGPAFAGDGSVLGLTSPVDGSDEREYRIVRSGDVCAVVASAVKAMPHAPAPATTRLPVEPLAPLARATLEAAAAQYPGGRVPYRASASDFEVAFITPGIVFAARTHLRPRALPVRPSRLREPDPLEEIRQRALTDFGAWSEYLAEDPPVLIVRATPRMVEGFWRMIARGAAMSQGIAIPAMKHFKAGFLRMQAFCGANEVTPVHRFTLERPISSTETVSEGLYVFDPAAFAPSCGQLRLVMYSEKTPDSPDTLVVDPKILEFVRDELALYRSNPPAPVK